MLQGYYEVEQCKKNRLSSLITGIPNIRRILFWDTDFDKIDWGKTGISSLPGSLREATGKNRRK